MRSKTFPAGLIAGHVCCRARKELAKIFSRIIQARRGSNTKEDDMLQSFIESRYEKVSTRCTQAPQPSSFLAGAPGRWTWGRL